jgi:hypothetical protein
MTTTKTTAIPIPMGATPTPINRRGALTAPWMLRPIGLSIDLWVLRLEIRARNACPYDRLVELLKFVQVRLSPIGRRRLDF